MGIPIDGVSTYLKTKTMKTRNPWQTEEICHIEMETLKDQMETFKKCSLELIDTQYHEPVDTTSMETTPGNRGVTSSQSSREGIG